MAEVRSRDGSALADYDEVDFYGIENPKRNQGENLIVYSSKCEIRRRT